MSEAVSYNPVGQEVDERNLRLFCSRVCAKTIKVIPIVGYLVLLSWRFVGLIFFIWFIIYSNGSATQAGYLCFDLSSFDERSPSARLERLPSWQIMLAAWLIACIVNTLVVILVLAKVPGYDGYLPTLRKNAKDARFWSLFLQLLVSITYKSVIIIKVYDNEPTMFYPMLFILEGIFTTLAVYFWNGVPAPWKNPRVPAKHWAYRLTLVVFLLEKFFLFLLSSFHTATRAASSHHFLTAAISAADATFFYSLTKFFWNKLFYGERNLLINDNV